VIYILKYGFRLDPFVVIYLTDFIFLLQTFEWIAMLYLIRYQKNKTVEEIAYEYNAEHMDEKLN